MNNTKKQAAMKNLQRTEDSLREWLRQTADQADRNLFWKDIETVRRVKSFILCPNQKEGRLFFEKLNGFEQDMFPLYICQAVTGTFV